jgi:hypothetical protein
MDRHRLGELEKSPERDSGLPSVQQAAAHLVADVPMPRILPRQSITEGDADITAGRLYTEHQIRTAFDLPRKIRASSCDPGNAESGLASYSDLRVAALRVICRIDSDLDDAQQIVTRHENWSMVCVGVAWLAF